MAVGASQDGGSHEIENIFSACVQSFSSCEIAHNWLIHTNMMPAGAC